MTFRAVWNQVRLMFGDETVLETDLQPQNLYPRDQIRLSSVIENTEQNSQYCNTEYNKHHEVLHINT